VLHLYNIPTLSETKLSKFANTLRSSTRLKSFSFVPSRFATIPKLTHLINSMDKLECLKDIFIDLRKWSFPLEFFEQFANTEKVYRVVGVMMKFHLDGKTKKYVKRLKKLSFTKDIPITHLRVDIKLDLESVDFATIDGFFTFIQTFKEQ